MYQQTLLVAIEGVDGAGKNTLTTKVATELEKSGAALARMACPRYGTTHADLIAAALRGEMGDLVDSPFGMATLFALDRKYSLAPGQGLAAAVSSITAESTDGPRIVLLDRWVASNAAYSAARLQQPVDLAGGVVDWVAELEYGTFELPIPDLTILLDVPVELARERAAGREAQDASRTRDAYERDASLQDRTATAYRALADNQWMGPWIRVAADVDPADVANTILGLSPQ
ncbi:MAG: dTMP kinase [Lawsonella sp.]